MFEEYVEPLSEEITMRQIYKTTYDSDTLQMYYDLEAPETLGDQFSFMKDLMADLGLDATFFIKKFCGYLGRVAESFFTDYRVSIDYERSSDADPEAADIRREVYGHNAEMKATISFHLYTRSTRSTELNLQLAEI